MFKISKNEWWLIVFVAIAGFIFSSRAWLLYLRDKTPISGLFVYYVVLFLAAVILAKIGLKVINVPVKGVSQVIGVLLITFSFFIIFNWESPYVQYISEGHLEGASPIFYQAEDGATYYFWNTVVGIQDMDRLRLLTFILTPIVLTLFGTLLVTQTRFGLI